MGLGPGGGTIGRGNAGGAAAAIEAKVNPANSAVIGRNRRRPHRSRRANQPERAEMSIAGFLSISRQATGPHDHDNRSRRQRRTGNGEPTLGRHRCGRVPTDPLPSRNLPVYLLDVLECGASAPLSFSLTLALL
jgi:hypothetical protein